MQINTAFDFRTEIGPGRDPDAYSPTLRRYHKLLWSKTFPDGRDFTLSDASWSRYLHHRSDLGEFRMTSDTSVGRAPHGWYVDNIKVQSCALAQPDAIFADDFES